MGGDLAFAKSVVPLLPPLSERGYHRVHQGKMRGDETMLLPLPTPEFEPSSFGTRVHYPASTIRRSGKWLRVVVVTGGWLGKGRTPQRPRMGSPH